MLRLKCLRHPRFDGRGSPRASCHQCIEIRNIRYAALAARLEVSPSESSITEGVVAERLRGVVADD